MKTQFRRSALCAAILSAVNLFVGMIPRVSAADYSGYTALDPSQPVSFDGKTVKWNGKTFALDENTVFLDYRLQAAQLAGNPYAFNTLKDAAKALKNGTAEKPMLLLTAPGVYWVDDPDDPVIRGTNGTTTTGMTIACNHLYFYGLNTKRENVVFAVNRGQTQGSEGNFTMFAIQGTGLKSENVTFGNYCSVDLKFPLNPSLSRARRVESIVQAQLFSYSGGDGVAINSGFVSRLNLLPFATTYLNCHLESSAHAGGRNNVYIGCELEFYGTNFSSGRAFLNCDIYLKPLPSIYQGRTVHRFGFMDGIGSGCVAIDTRIHRSQEMIDNNVAAEVSWDRVPQAATTRSYQHNVTLDGKPYIIQEASTPGATVIIPDGSDLLKAFKVTQGGKTYYNVPNILPGTDPFGYSPTIKAAAVAAGKDENYYLGIPTSAALQFGSGAEPAGRGRAGAGAAGRGRGAPGPAGRGGAGLAAAGRGGADSGTTIRSGQTTATLTYSVAPASFASSPALGKWQFTASNPAMVRITPGANNSITVAGTNNTTASVDVFIMAKSELGVEGCAKLTVEPGFVAPPTFAKAPAITPPADGRVTLDYALNLGSPDRTDESLITWYRCTDAQGANPLKVAVSRQDKPEINYAVVEGDVGHYLMAAIQPKHSVSEAGTAQTVYSRAVIAKNDVKTRAIETDFHNFPADPQPKVLPGTWTVDGYFAPEALTENKSPRYTANPDSWTYGSGQPASFNFHGLNYGLFQTARGARLFYTPASGQHGDMTVQAKFAPNKNTGQGFGSATDQFLEVYIKYDLATRTGYGLRMERITPEEITAIGYNPAGAVAGCAFFLVKYVDGVMTPLSKKIMSSAFVTICTVDLTVKNGRLVASATSGETVRGSDVFGYPREVRFDEPVEGNSYGGTGMLFTGTVGVNATVVTGWRTSWSD